MKKLSMITRVVTFCLLVGSMGLCAGEPADRTGRVYEDLAKVKAVDPTKEYCLGASGICGMVKEDHILVTYVQPGSPADGKVQVGDLVRGLQHRGLGADIRATVAKRIYRLGRDWDWKLVVTVERGGLRGGQGNTIFLHLRLERTPGLLYHLGPTGFFAKLYSDHLVVDQLDKGSPADGKLRVGDQILAVDGKPIAGNIFELFAQCIDKAESKRGGGILKLKVKREGAEGAPAEELAVALQLKVLGTYSQTAPYNCPKTDAIITQTADKLMKDGKYGRLNIGLLGLLATGEKKYINHVGRVLHRSKFADPGYGFSLGATYVSWSVAYQAIILSEYYLLTGDKYVLPTIKTHAVTIARGQDAAGLWNHRMADPAANFGKLHGRLYGYGAINQTSVALFISLIMANKCGIDDPQVRAAIEKTHSLYSNWIEKGALPYGNHGPEENLLTNNGTSNSIAVAYALIDNKKGARFYSKMSAAAHDEIFTGHTGPWFNIMWSGLGANVAGPEVSAAYNRKLNWLRTVTRTWDGRFLNMAAWGTNPKPGNLCTSGAYLLNYCTGRRAICITGKDADQSLWLKGKAAIDAVTAGTFDDSKLDSRSLLALLGSGLPRVRCQVAELLAVRDADVADEVMEMLATGSRDQRIGAIHAFDNLNITSAVDELMTIIRNDKDDLWTRQLALRTICKMEGTQKYGTELLGILVADKPYDVHGNLDMDLGFALVKILGDDPYALGLDKDLFYKAVSKLLDHRHHAGRIAGMSLIKNIPLQDIYRVADKMIYVIEDKDRTYTSYHEDGQRQLGLEILNRLNIKEVIDLTVGTIKEPTGRGGPRTRGRVKLLKTFGGEAKYAIPKIKEVLGKQADEIVKIIEESKTTRKMISLEEAKRVGMKKTK